jgi:hypothetical protein
MTQINPWICSQGAQVKLWSERCVPKVLKLSSGVSECKPLPGTNSRASTAVVTPPRVTTARRSIVLCVAATAAAARLSSAHPTTRGLDSFPFQLNLSY